MEDLRTARRTRPYNSANRIENLRMGQVWGMHYCPENQPKAYDYMLEARKQFKTLNSFLWYASTSVSFEKRLQLKPSEKLKELLTYAANNNMSIQIGFEPKDASGTNLTCKKITEQLTNKQSDLYKNIESWALNLKKYTTTVILRPISEFNYYNPSKNVPPWTLVPRTEISSGPQTFANAWNKVRDIFRNASADNVLFAFNPVGHTTSDPANDTHVISTIKAIGAKNIDIAGLNVYPSTTCNLRAEGSFQQIAKHWKDLYNKAGIGDKPFFIGECNIANRTDNEKAEWLKNAFEYCKNKSNQVAIFTIFNGCQVGPGGYVDKYRIKPGTAPYKVLTDYMKERQRQGR